MLYLMKIGTTDAVPNEDRDESFGDGETEDTDAADMDADSGDTPEKAEEIQQRPKRRLYKLRHKYV